jgi:hypothetical protein
MSEKLLFGVNNAGFVILGTNDYEYSNDNMVLELLNKYKKVIFDNSFNSAIDWLPEGITDIYLGIHFNQPLANLPSTTKTIKITYDEHNYNTFNQPLDYLPPGLERLEIWFNSKYNYPLNNLPIGLKKFILFANNFTHSINNLPDSIETIQISTFDYVNTLKLPSNLKSINIIETCKNNKVWNKYHLLTNLEKKYPNAKFTYR